MKSGVWSRFVLVVPTVVMLVACSTGSVGAAGAATKTKTTTKKTAKATKARVTTAKAVTTLQPKTTVVAVVPTSTLAAVRAKAPFEQYGEVRFTLTGADGKKKEYCALLADTQELQNRGLMGRTDLAGYNAMLFTWPTDVANGFWMRTVPIWLSIAWWDNKGKLVTKLDMAPCGDSADCPTYVAERPYRVAMETMRGGIDELGVTAETVLAIGGTCPSRA
jgi:uncharacterized membrane protein (UPF0127 family)